MSPRTIVSLHNGLLLAAVLIGFIFGDQTVLSFGVATLLASLSAIVLLSRADLIKTLSHLLAAVFWLGGVVAIGVIWFGDSISTLSRLKSAHIGVLVGMVIAFGYLVPTIVLLLYKFSRRSVPATVQMNFEHSIRQEDTEWGDRYYRFVIKGCIAISLLLLCVWVILLAVI